MGTESFSDRVKDLLRPLTILETEAQRATPPGARSAMKSIQQLHEGLERLDAEARAVDWTIEELRRQVADLTELDRRKNEFLAMLSHELRSPLAVISHAIEVMDQLGPPTPQLTRLREMIVHQTQHLAHLVDDLLDVGRLTTGTFKLAKEAVSLTTVVEQSLEAVRPALQERGHQLEVELPSPPVWLEVDLTRLEQVLVNLLENAIQFTAPNGRIWLWARREGGMVALSVRDTGAGIDPERLPHIFDLFSRKERKPDTAAEGLGVGLTLVRRLVEMHGGSVAAFSDGPGHGSEFLIRLPALPEPQPDSNRIQQGTVKAGGRLLRILVVEDNGDVGRSLAMLLRLWGHEVRVVTDGPAALEAVAEEAPDVVLLDIGMPGMDGYEIAKRMRQQPGLERALLVAVTGYGQTEDRGRSRDAGCDIHLVKPVNPDELRRVLATLPEVPAPIPAR